VKEHENLVKLVKEQKDILEKLQKEKESQVLSPVEQKSSPPVQKVEVKESTKTQRKSFPGAQKHRILTLSDDDFEFTKVNEMMSWYLDEETSSSVSSFNCPGDFGNALVNRWRNTKQIYCKSPGSLSIPNSKPVDSSITCYPVKQTRHFGGGDNLCLLQDISMNVGIFGQERITTPVIRRYVDTVHERLPYISFPNGFIRSTCQSTDGWRKESLPGWNYDLTMGSLESISGDTSLCSTSYS
jgi:hypothetical protein